jgi:hypothetical protein
MGSNERMKGEKFSPIRLKLFLIGSIIFIESRSKIVFGPKKKIRIVYPAGLIV